MSNAGQFPHFNIQYSPFNIQNSAEQPGAEDRRAESPIANKNGRKVLHPPPLLVD
jgi:hypothetical protein